VVFIPKCRRKVLYGQLRKHLGEVFRKLAEQKESRNEEGHLLSDHVHMMISIPPKYAVSQVVGFISGHAPYGPRSHNAEEIARAVCESDPDRPSAVITRPVGWDEALGPAEIGLMRDGSVQKLRKRLRGDLDNIVLMALRKEPQRRYSSVEIFATDIRRHLDNLPVIERGDSRRYRARKFIARNKPAVLAASIVFLTLIVGLAVTLREARIARAERARAEQRFRDVREIANSDLFELHDAIKKLPGSGSVRNLVIQRALKYLEKLSRDASGDREVMHELATGYERIADLQGNFSGPGSETRPLLWRATKKPLRCARRSRLLPAGTLLKRWPK